jgi:large subunit ribosomal protein L25
MMEIIKLSANPRPEHGKGASHRLRKQGQIPAIAYGRELKATSLSISPKGLLDVLKSDHGQNAVVELAVEGGAKLTVMVRDYAYHPITRELVHADFVQVKLDQPVNVDVPFRCTGKAKGLVEGGILQQIYRRLPVSCLPERIPAFIEADVTDLGMGDSLKAGQVHMPDGVTIRLPADHTVVVIAAPEKVVEEEPKPGAVVPGAPAAAAGAPGAPAAAGAAAAPAAAAAAGKPAAKPEKKK